jgi:hypothetical protein
MELQSKYVGVLLIALLIPRKNWQFFVELVLHKKLEFEQL